MLKIYPVETGENLEQVRILWREYADFLKICFAERSGLPLFKEYFKNYEEEIASQLPDNYNPPKGCLLLAKYQDKTAGCVGLRDFGDGACEMKRLFVRPEYRGLGIAKALAKAVIEQGRNIGYKSMCLNTNRRMAEAARLYKSLGFEEIAPYEHFDIEGMLYLGLAL